MQKQTKPKTIAALCTAPGIGSLSVIRVSGFNLNSLIKKITNGKLLKNRFATYSSFFDFSSQKILDNCIFTFFKAPNSFTGEDVLEISCHGGNYIYKSLLDSLYKLNVFPADPGEFSYRAFLNKKLDLLQAEATSSLIQSNSKIGVQESLKNLTGYFSNIISTIKKNIVSVLVLLEKELDFNEEEITLSTNKHIFEKVLFISNNLEKILNTFSFGNKIKTGFRIVLLGKPNAGKSSLFNHLLGENRTIVSSIPGTTRDFIESWIEVGGFPVCLIDTAGFWESQDPLDSLSVKKTLIELNNADILLFLDEKNPFQLKNHFTKIKNNKKILFIKTKKDLCKTNIKNCINISIKTGEGIDLLFLEIKKILTSFSFKHKDLPTITTKRQEMLLKKAFKTVDEVLSLLQNNGSPDIIVFVLRDLLSILETLIGSIYNNDIIDEIFNSFCIGK